MTTRQTRLEHDHGRRAAWLFALAGTALGGFVAGRWLNRGNVVDSSGAIGSGELLGMLGAGAVLLLCVAAALWLRRWAVSTDGAARDPVTGLYTRAYAEEMIPGLIARDDRSGRSQLAMILLSVDFLDQIERRHDAAAVQQVLCFIGRQIAGQIRAGDVPVRFDGQRLAVFLHCEEIDQAIAFGRRVSMLVAGQQLDWRGEAIKLTTCMGMVLRAPGETLQALEVRAEDRLAQARLAGNNQIAA